MASPISDYAVLGDTESAALVARDGSMDWLCLPRFDSGACFAALLGDKMNGRWKLAPTGEVTGVKRAYRDGSLILETEFTTAEGTVRLIDVMPPRQRRPNVVRIVEGITGRVPIHMELIIRFDYGHVVPWVRCTQGSLLAIGGPNALTLRTPLTTEGKDMTTVADFTVGPKERVPFALTWHPSHEPSPEPIDPERAVSDAEVYWKEWTARCTYRGPYAGAVNRSLLALKALTHAPTGGIVAAATTSLPEWPGGVRNWDYRYCWLRDATFTLLALINGGYTEEAVAWRDWLLRAVAGDPDKLQIMYGVGGERRLPEWELSWLSGYADSRPVRVGNAAVDQLQLDVYGEVMDALHQGSAVGMAPDETAWSLQRSMLGVLEKKLHLKDQGLWEVRGPPRHFTHSKVMCWVALDRAVKTAESCKFEGPVARWKKLRSDLHAEICRSGFDPTLKSFVQYYGGKELDASLLMIPLVGFLPASDPRVQGTVRAIQRSLMHDGFVRRYSEQSSHVDGLPAGEGVFLACTFWLADNLAMMGERDEARAIFERLLTLRNDVGLLSEEYDPRSGQMLGNFPQAFSHTALVNSAFTLAHEAHKPPLRPRHRWHGC